MIDFLKSLFQCKTELYEEPPFDKKGDFGYRQALLNQTVEMLKKHEGLRLKPYRDTVGKLTIGYGRNLDDVGINDEEALHMLLNDARKALEEAETFDWFKKLDLDRASVIVNMIFNMGLPRFRQFKKTIAALEESDYEKASEEMLDSLWAKQVGRRAIELSEIMRHATKPLQS